MGDERKSAVNAVVEMVMTSDPNNDNQRQMATRERCLIRVSKKVGIWQTGNYSNLPTSYEICSELSSMFG